MQGAVLRRPSADSGRDHRDEPVSGSGMDFVPGQRRRTYCGGPAASSRPSCPTRLREAVRCPFVDPPLDRTSPDTSEEPTIGEFIRQQRILAGLTQRQLGQLVGTSFTHISKVEASREVPSADLLRAIAGALEGDVDEFLLRAGRVPRDVTEVVVEKSDLAPRFLRSWRDGQISDEAVEDLLRQSGADNRPVLPRTLQRHEERAALVLSGYALETGWTRSLPVPVDQIVESAGLHILWQDLDEPPGDQILGALDPQTSTIMLNERHLDLMNEVIGPEPFTLAHEYGHWLYDAENPAQLTFDGQGGGRLFCRGLRQVHLEDQSRIREVNANRFAACLLLPRDLLLQALPEPFASTAALRATARAWGVSKRTLEVRLSQMGRSDLLSLLG